MAILDWTAAGKYAAAETKSQIENIISRHCKIGKVVWKDQENAPPWYKMRHAEIGRVEAVLL